MLKKVFIATPMHGIMIMFKGIDIDYHDIDISSKIVFEI